MRLVILSKGEGMNLSFGGYRISKQCSISEGTDEIQDDGTKCPPIGHTVVTLPDVDGILRKITHLFVFRHKWQILKNMSNF